MKLVVHKNNLQRALGFVERVTAKNTALPILSNVLLKTENGRLRLTATNLEVGVSSMIGAKIEADGQAAVPGRILADVIRAVPQETITLSISQETLHIDAGSYKTSILCFSATEYPIIPKVDNGSTQTLPVSVFRSMLSTVSDSVAASESRPELAGALLRFEAKRTTLAATDSFRLAERTTAVPNKNELTAIIPRGTINELLRVLSDVSGDIMIRVADNQIAFSHEDVEIVSRLIDGKYPDYRKVIPEKFLSKTLVRKDEIENAAKIAALFSSSISDIKLECGEKGATITAKNSSKGEAAAHIEANTKGDDFEIAINYHYFLDGLKVIPTEKVVLEFTGKGSPFVLRPSDEAQEVVYLIMPLRN